MKIPLQIKLLDILQIQLKHHLELERKIFAKQLRMDIHFTIKKQKEKEPEALEFKIAGSMKKNICI